MKPKVSICLPSLNTFPFLPARKDSILAQTLSDWELVVVDDGSTDGSWEFFEQWQREDDRVKLFQGPGNGLYPGWNDAIARANGELIYVATSDDTMALNCLERLSAVLSEHPGFGIAHCNLRTIDLDGNDTECEWYPTGPFIKSSGPLQGEKHFRYAPFDGLLHLTGASVYASITQLLIRRSVFDEVGFFESQWGAMGDFHWNMRASLVTNTVHVPDTWGGWRLHPQSATNRSDKTHFYQTVQDMIDHAVASSLPVLPKHIGRNLSSSWSRFILDRKDWWEGGGSSRLGHYAFVLKKICCCDVVALEYAKWRLGMSSHFQTDPVELVEHWYRQAGLGDPMSTEDRQPELFARH